MTPAARTLRDCAAPAKLNVFLHVTGRRPDGYHTLQTAFQLLDWHDTLHFTARADDAVVRVTPVAGVPAEADLTVRAARLLQAHTGCRLGVEIEIDKRLPMGAGLGGGSSDAATTLLALNRLWSLNLERARLQALGLALGADVPFFLAGGNAFAEGVGERLTPVTLPPRHFLVVKPGAHVSTAQIFGAGELTRDTKPVTITDFLAQQNPFAFGRNDLQPVVAKRYTEVAQVLDWFSGMVPARMTGSGACVFSAFDDRDSAVAVQAALPSGWSSVVVAGLARHPLSGCWS